jgi:serine/threonine protein kinase
VLFEMLAGSPPFAGATANALAVQILQARPNPLSALDRTLPAELDAIVLKMLAKSLDQRYQAAATVAAELRSVAAILDVRDGVAEPVNVAPVTARTRRHAGFWIAMVLVGASIIAVLLLLTSEVGARWLSSLTRTWRHAFGLVLRSW